VRSDRSGRVDAEHLQPHSVLLRARLGRPQRERACSSQVDHLDVFEEIVVVPLTRPRVAQVLPAPTSRDKSSPITFTQLRQSPRGVNPIVNGCFVEYCPLPFGLEDVATRYQGLPVVIWNRYQHSYGTTSVCHLNGLPTRDPGEISTGVLAKLSYSDAFHMLHSSTLALRRRRSVQATRARAHDQGGRPPWADSSRRSRLRFATATHPGPTVGTVKRRTTNGRTA
jgi:hypothetical protein